MSTDNMLNNNTAFFLRDKNKIGSSVLLINVPDVVSAFKSTQNINLYYVKQYA